MTWIKFLLVVGVSFCSEIDESFIAMMNFMISNSPKRKRENVYAVAANGFVTQDTVSEKFQMPNAIYMDDQWHLFDSILPKRFRGLVFQNNEGFLGDVQCAFQRKIQGGLYEGEDDTGIHKK